MKTIIDTRSPAIKYAEQYEKEKKHNTLYFKWWNKVFKIEVVKEPKEGFTILSTIDQLLTWIYNKR